jgi:hypothetical protein
VAKAKRLSLGRRFKGEISGGLRGKKLFTSVREKGEGKGKGMEI